MVLRARLRDLADTALLSLAASKPNFGNLSFTVRIATFAYGARLTVILSFLIPC